MTSWQTLSDVWTSLQFDDTPAGGALVVYHRGKKVVDSAIGQALSSTAWSAHTLSVNFSVGKGVMATLIAILVSKGLLAYDKPISHFWRSFGANAKAHITLQDVLTHRAGLFNVSQLTNSSDDLLDWQTMIDKVAAMSADVPQAQESHHYVSAYSALVSGWILGQVVCLATGLSLQQALDTYLAEPLAVAGELFYGLPSAQLGKVAKPVRYFDQHVPTKQKPTLKPDTPKMIQTLSCLPISRLWQERLSTKALSTAAINKLYFDGAGMNMQNYKNALMPNGRDGLAYHRDEVMQALIPAANGVSSANALAKLYAMHANDGVWQDKVLIDVHTLQKMRQVSADGLDAVMPANMRWRLGFHRLFSLQHTPSAYGHMGYNGSVAFVDPARQLALAFIHNFDTTMLNDVRQFAIIETAIELANQKLS